MSPVSAGVSWASADDHAEIRVGTLVLDLPRRQARVGESVADLSDREFRLLHFHELEPFLEDVFMRWSEVAPRAWRLGPLVGVQLLVDPDRLRAALDALLENAIKYTHEHAAIELRARRADPDQVLIEVEDEGSGIQEDALGRIFERFARADAARARSTGGVGLGLAIVDAIAKAHGGRCMVRNTGHGSIFALELPAPTAARGGQRLPELSSSSN